MKKTLILIIAFVLAGLLVVPVLAQEKEKGKTGCTKHTEKSMLCPCLSKLNLSDKQKEEITALHKTFMEERDKNRSEMQKISAELMQLMMADKPDTATIDKKIEEQGKLWVTWKKKAIEHHMKIASLLTPEQLKLWKEHMGTCGFGSMMRMKEGMMHKGMCKGHGEKMKHHGCAGHGMKQQQEEK